MRTIALLILLASSALAQDVKRGSFLKKRAYQTYATTTLYVDPTGSDSNPCTASGTSACLTVNGVLAKLPRFLNHNVTINVAAGTYSEGVVITGFQIANGVTFSVTGTMSAFTVATGTDSGTTTAASAGSSAGPATITDSNQAWTTNDLRGRFITFTSGSLNGLSYPIYANTATTVTFPTASSAGVGSTYRIETPGTIFAGGTASHTVINMMGQTSGQLILSNIEWSRTSGGTGFFFGPTANGTSIINNRFIHSGTGFAMQVAVGPLSVSRSYVESSAASQTAISTTSLFGLGVVKLGGSNNVVRQTGTGNTAAAILNSSFNVMSGGVFEASGTGSNPVLSLNIIGGTQAPSLWVYCNTGTSSVGLGTPAISSTIQAPASSISSNGGTRITGCATGIRISTGQQWSLLSPGFDTVTTAFLVEKGGLLNLVSGTPTFTSVTNEIQLDNSDNYTFSFLNALPSPQVLTNSYGSTVIR